MRLTCLNMVYEMAKEDPRIFFIGSDLGFGTLRQFRAEIPDRFIMEGINEAHAVGLAAGLALEGKIVFVNTIATFLTRRCLEQIVLDLCLHQVNVRLIGNGGGVVYAPLGSTHLAFEDLALLRAIPNMTIVAPADADEMRRFMPQTLDYPGPIYIRLAKGFDPVVSREDPPFIIGQGLVIRPGRDVLVLTTGITLRLALASAEILESEGIEMAILHLPTIKPLDQEKILNMASMVKAVITIEEHTIIGGLGSALAELMAEADFDQPKRFRRLGLPDAFPDQLGYGSQDSLLARHHITSGYLVEVARNLLGKMKRTTG
ncbi:MAG: transketolase [Deltaproteobacteria bacterium]|nr:transketolase [Deltaproteobacteria bacterium]